MQKSSKEFFFFRGYPSYLTTTVNVAVAFLKLIVLLRARFDSPVLCEDLSNSGDELIIVCYYDLLK